MFEHAHLERIYRALHIIITNQEKQMADLAAVQAAVAALDTAVSALEAKLANPPAFVLQSDLDPVVESINADRTKVEALTANAP